MKSPFSISVDGTALAGERRDGVGVPLVMVHGFGGSRHDWRLVADAFPAARPLIQFDQRGFGDSPVAHGVAFSHSDDLLALLDQLEVPRADLCGMSLGGATVLNFALNHPDRVRRLVLISPLMVGWSWSQDWIERWKAIGRKARAGQMDEARALWWQHPLFDQARTCPHADMLKEAIDAFHGQQWVQDDQRPELPETERLHELACPTLLLTGDRDTEDFRLIAEVIEAAGQHVTRIDYPRAGHMLNLERPTEIAAAISAFLSDE